MKHRSPNSSPRGPIRLKLTTKAANDIENDIRIRDKDHANVAELLKMTLEARAKNTDKNYIPKQQEFVDWALKSKCNDRDTVTEDKLLSFLKEEVIVRPLRTRGKKSLAADEVELDEQVLKWTSVRSYITAITDLYNAQKARNMNSNPSPRGNLTRDLIKVLQRRDTAAAKENYADKARDTYLDGYSESQFKELCLAVWKASSVGHVSAIQTSCYLRTLVDQLLGHYLLARGNDRRQGEISDLHTFEFPDEGPTPCFPLIMTMRSSKTNQFGRLETMGAFRNKDPFICPLGAVGFYLLYRWDLTEEAFPDFSQRSRWYNIRLLLSTRLPGADADDDDDDDNNNNVDNDDDNNAATAAATATPAAPPTPKKQPASTKPLSYNAQLYWIALVFRLIGLNSSKKTHLFRAIGAKLAELKGVSEDQISRVGRWTLAQMIGCYLTCLPHNFMRRMGGHPDQKGCFEIRRAAVTPPDGLLEMLWPELDQWRGGLALAPVRLMILRLKDSAIFYATYGR
jgi:hypothetical protein